MSVKNNTMSVNSSHTDKFNSEVKSESFDALVLTDSSINESIELFRATHDHAMTNLVSTLQSYMESHNNITIEHILSALFIAIIGAFTAYMFNFFHWRMVEKRHRLSKMSMALENLICDLENTATNYWVQDYDDNKKHEFRASEVSMVAKLRLIERYSKTLTNGLAGIKNEKITIIKHELDKFTSDIYDVATGNEFQSATRKASINRAQQVSNLCSDIKAMLSSIDFCV